jgi:hypothetical protein
VTERWAVRPIEGTQRAWQPPSRVWLRGEPQIGRGEGITSSGSYCGPMAADRFSLLALRRRSVALWLVAFGSFSLAISYVVPVAATLAAGTDTITPLRQLSAPTLEFPALKVPPVARHAQAVPTAPTLSTLQNTGALSPVQGSVPRYAPEPARLPVVTNSYTTRPAPAQPSSNEKPLPVYEDAIGAPPPAMPVVAQASPGPVSRRSSPPSTRTRS